MQISEDIVENVKRKIYNEVILIPTKHPKISLADFFHGNNLKIKHCIPSLGGYFEDHFLEGEYSGIGRDL